MKILAFTLALIACSICLAPQAIHAEETDKLTAILIPGEDWQPVVQGLGFADGLSSDATTGNIFFSDIKAKDPTRPATYMLTPRESEVLTYLSKGFTIKEIASLMGIKWFTVNDHIKSDRKSVV